MKHSKIFYRRLQKHRFILAVVSVFGFFILSSISLIAANAQTVGPTDTRVVSLFVDGKEQVIPTRSENVGDLVEKLNIKMYENDLIEPALTTPILEDNMRVTIYRARPVTVIDGDYKKTVLSPHESPRLVAKDAGVVIFPEDKATFSQPEDLLGEGILGEKLTIDRATKVQINLYGNIFIYRTHAITVADVLAEKKIVPATDDTISPATSSLISDNLTIAINHFGKQVITEEEPIPFETQSTIDPNLPIGQINVQTKGVKGKKIVTYEVDLKDGKESGRKKLQEVIASQPVDQVEVRGGKVVVSGGSNVALGQQMAAERGWTGSEWNCLYLLWNKESRWDHLARNRSSGAYGIPQALPGSKMGAGWQSDPVVQIRWGLGYIGGRYGTPCRAWGFSGVNGWY